MDSLELFSFKVMEEYLKEEQECTEEMIIVAGSLARKAVQLRVVNQYNCLQADHGVTTA